MNTSNYIFWSGISNFASSMENVIGTDSMLYSLDTTPNKELINLSINFIGKDIFGQLGGMYYINKYGKKSDNNPKVWIRNNNIIQQTCIFTECATPFIPSYLFLPIAGLASIGRNVIWTGYGAISAKCIQKIAPTQAIGEVYSKISIINTLCSSFGMTFGLFISYKIPDHMTRIFCILPIIAFIRIYSLNRALKNLII